MGLSEKRKLLLLAILVVTVASANARSLEKRQAKENYFEQFIKQLGELKLVPIIGEIISPYISIAQSLLASIDSSTDGNLSAIVNSVMPCKFTGVSVKCEGTLDKDSMLKLAKKILNIVPVDMLPPSMASMIKLASDMI